MRTAAPHRSSNDDIRRAVLSWAVLISLLATRVQAVSGLPEELLFSGGASSTLETALPGGRSPVAAIVSSPEPWIAETMPRFLRRRVEEAFAIALEQLREEPRCEALFWTLGGEGGRTLAATMYLPSDLRLERSRCLGAAALTWIGRSQTLICRNFARLSGRQGAAILIHEGLHTAGLGEHPVDPAGLTSTQITELVQRSCSL